MDIDGFKDINDSYGHICGDQVLIEISKFFINSMRDNDSFGRWGGEDFLMIIDVTKKKKLLEIIERLREKLHDTPICYKGHQIQVTITVGVILVDCTKKQSVSEWVHLADTGLYEGKKSGKNKMVFIEY